MKRFKFPFEYELSPEVLEKDEDQWISLRLKNIERPELRNLDVKLHSIDSLHIDIYSSGERILVLSPDQEQYINFEVYATATSHLYITVKYNKPDSKLPYFWDSPWLQQEVRGNAAKLQRVLVSNPYGSVGKEMKVEATVRGFRPTGNGLDLQFWADTPSGKYEELARIRTKKLDSGEEASYSAKIIPRETGYYNIYATLYDDNYNRIDRESDTVWVDKA